MAEENNQYTFEHETYRKTYWHTCSHILAQAMKRLHPDVKLAIGPAIDNGFYYDFDTPEPFSESQLEELEAEMRKICKEKLKLERFELPRADALAFMEEKDEPYKVELIRDLPEDAVISFYRQGDFTDLCAGPHLDSTGRVKGNGIKLTACNAAYWRGDSSRKQLQRIYGIAFPKKDELDAWVAKREEALKRDHNKLGRELEYFTTVDVIGQGLPVMLPKGARVIQVLQRWVEDEEQKRGYLLTKTPLMAKSDLYKISGHWDHYLDGMFVLGDPHDETRECFALRPMTCPFQYQVYLNRARSYRDLPMRLGETSTLFRNEDSGEMHGLIRVRQFTISEGHLVLRPEQLEEEFKGCLDLAKYCLGTVGLLDKCTFRFSQWDPANPNNKYEGTAEQWELAQATMAKILDDLDVTYTIGIDEAAFYGPKLDIQYRNVYGKEDTLVTIQIDMLLAKQFGMEYTDADGQKKTPYIIHRTSLGCYERTLAYLIEEYAGALPAWMAPEQVRVLPVTDRACDYAAEVARRLEGEGLRATADYRNEKIGKKIREATLEKVPYMLVVGDRDMEHQTVSVRHRSGEDLGAMSQSDFLALLQDEVERKCIK
ncbi:threonine--tRNA ligase [Flavonifractor sp. DFI.6.63]|uniref:Threonine--tRNA ligase n=1 Tax=Lawsonibacter hominis TaxID=2763053 RepID=A0A8J6J0J7_9FIRM|nr:MULTISPECIES: threonine--tRNA ligase [Oscillospiraceae]MDU2195817.1 threonine--tRNA ligase [Clostridiales bacterium]MDY2976640.1 threonine--tRNA ligase [Oscillospiraceae bacterium]MBC5733672.1 threonine--tRNA ligase [Lawsonibacter hominis]MCI6399319.1 threonine--tRNA ligase [Lawsonibacter sp.]MCQ5030581.1 threonine--tRNA ligase [Flavonifractor sp. DFI.6.63]